MTEILLGASVALNLWLLYREARRAWFRAKYKRRQPQQRPGARPRA